MGIDMMDINEIEKLVDMLRSRGVIYFEGNGLKFQFSGRDDAPPLQQMAKKPRDVFDILDEQMQGGNY